MGERAGDGKLCFDNIKAFRYASCISSRREPPARGGASRGKTPFLSPCSFESLVVWVGPVGMVSPSATYIVKAVTGDSQEYTITQYHVRYNFLFLQREEKASRGSDHLVSQITPRTLHDAIVG